jgi:hypothetical protein
VADCVRYNRERAAVGLLPVEETYWGYAGHEKDHANALPDKVVRTELTN